MQREYPDLSSNNGPVNIALAVGSGIPCLCIKATEGAAYVNPYHAGQAHAAHALSVSVMHYHFCRPGATPVRTEAQWFWEHVAPLWRPYDDLLIDLEVGSGTRKYLVDFGIELERLSHRRPYGYTYQSYYDTNALAGSLASRRWVIADLGGTPKVSGPDRLWCWQYTFTGTWPGVSGGVDRNRMNVRSAVWRAGQRRARLIRRVR